MRNKLTKHTHTHTHTHTKTLTHKTEKQTHKIHTHKTEKQIVTHIHTQIDILFFVTESYEPLYIGDQEKAQVY